MLSNFTRNVNKVIGSRTDEIEKNVYKHQNKLREIEKKLDKGAIKTPGEAVQALKGAFGHHLSGDEYRRIEKEISYDIK